jgi:hypothetical protein
MKAVFADSVYFFALLNARDTIHQRAVRFATQSENPLVTTAWIITEAGSEELGSADSRISERLRLFPCHDPRFWALIAVAVCSQKVDVYHVKSRRP